MATRALPIIPSDPVITNAQAAVQQLAFSIGNAICLFEVLENAMVEIVPDHSDASRIHGSLILGIETLRQHMRAAQCIAETMEAAA